MVKSIIAFFLFSIFGSLLSEEIQVSTQVPWNAVYANTSFDVTVLVSHPANTKIDPAKISMGGIPVQAKFVKDTPTQTGSIQSEYAFNTKGFPAGIQTLASVNVEINGKVFSSPPIAFEVKEGAKKAAEKEQPFLKVLPIFTGDTPLYPGQQFYVGYRYIYNASIDLTEENLPLLEIEGFKKLGDKLIDQNETNGISTVQFVQKFQADNPGTFSVKGAEVTGLPYISDASGNKKYYSLKLKAETIPLTIEVAPFPEESKPASFSGAIGVYTVKAELISRPKLNVGDSLNLSLAISGTGEFDSIKPPDLCCQPGFSGFFKQSDLPPAASVSTNAQGNTKSFKMELFVQNRDAKALPPIEFSSFDPKTKKYLTEKTNPISLEVASSPIAVPSPSPLQPYVEAKGANIKKFALPYFIPMPLYIGVIWAIGLIWLVFLIQVRKRRDEINALNVPKRSVQYYEAALHAKDQVEKFYPLLEKALRNLLYEKGWIAAIDTPLESIQNGEAEPIKDLLVKMEQARFNAKKELNVQEVMKTVKGYFK